MYVTSGKTQQKRVWMPVDDSLDGLPVAKSDMEDGKNEQDRSPYAKIFFFAIFYITLYFPWRSM